MKKASSSCTYITAAGDTDEYECIVKTRTIKKLSVYNLINCTWLYINLNWNRWKCLIMSKMVNDVQIHVQKNQQCLHILGHAYEVDRPDLDTHYIHNTWYSNLCEKYFTFIQNSTKLW